MKTKSWFDHWEVKKPCPICGQEITYLDDDKSVFTAHVKSCEKNFWNDKKSLGTCTD